MSFICREGNHFHSNTNMGSLENNDLNNKNKKPYIAQVGMHRGKCIAVLI
jgi:S-adenosylhomocysteine hydrolase